MTNPDIDTRINSEIMNIPSYARNMCYVHRLIHSRHIDELESIFYERLYHYAAKFKPEMSDNFGAYLCVFLRFETFKYVEGLKRNMPSIEPHSMEVYFIGVNKADISRESLIELFQEANLTDRERHVLLLVCEGCDFSRIGELFGSTKQYARYVYKRAIGKCQVVSKEKGYSYKHFELA